MKSYKSLKIKRIEIPSQSIKFSKKTSKLKKTNINPTINPYKKKFTYIFCDGSGNVAPRVLIKDKMERQKIINMYSEIWYSSLKKLSFLSDILK